MKAKWTIVIFVIVILVVVFSIVGLQKYFHQRNMVSDAEDRRRWLREIDEDNRKMGVIRDSNGTYIFVGTNTTKRPN